MALILPNEIKLLIQVLICKRSIQLNIIHIARLYKNPTNNKASDHRQDELAILYIMCKPDKLEFLNSLNIIFNMRLTIYHQQ